MAGDSWEEIAKEMAPAQALPDDASWEDVAKTLPQQRSGSSLLSMGARVAPALIGGVVGGIPGAVFGGGMGELLGQMIEGGDINKKQIALQAALGAIPGMQVPGVTSTLGRVGVRAAEGAALGGLGTAAGSLIEGKSPSWEDVAKSMALGGVLGAGAGGAEARFARKRPGAPDAPPTPIAVGQAARPEIQLDLPLAAGETPSPKLKIEQRVRELEAENQKMTSWLGMKPGEQAALDFGAPPSDPIHPAHNRPFQLTEAQIRKMNFYARHNPEQGLAYYQNLRRHHNEAPATRTVELGARILGDPVPTRGGWMESLGLRSSDPTIPHMQNPMLLLAKKFGQNSTSMVESFGPTGQRLAMMVRGAYDRFERELAEALDGPTGVLHRANELKLNEAERINITDVMEGVKAPMNARVEEITGLMKAQRVQIEDRATGFLELRDPITGEVRPWEPRENYFPHFANYEEIVKDPARLSRVIQDIQTQASVKRGGPVSLTEANEIFNQMRRHSRMEYGNLEVSRTFNINDYERDGIKAWSQYVESALKRMNEAEVFGRKGERAVEAVRRIGLEAGDDAAQAAQKYMSNVFGRDVVTGVDVSDRNASGMITAARSLQVGMKLGQAVIANAGQTNLTALVTGYRNVYEGFRQLRTTEGKKFARLAGATIEQTMRDLNESLGVGRFGSKVLEMTGFSQVEQFNRMLAANSGREFARDLVARLKGGALGNAAEEYKRHLRTMGIKPMEVMGRGYRLTQEEELSAARSVIERTQFKVKPQDLPLYWSSPLGKLVSQFSSFAFKAGKSIKDEVFAQAWNKGDWMNGNWKPLVRFALATPVLGEVFAGVQAFLRGKERPENTLERLAENYAVMGTIGLFYDAFRAASYGEVGVLRRLAGPTISDAAQLVAGGYEAVVEGKGAPLGKQITQNIPIIGPSLRPRLFPKEEAQ